MHFKVMHFQILPNHSFPPARQTFSDSNASHIPGGVHASDEHENMLGRIWEKNT